MHQPTITTIIDAVVADVVRDRTIDVQEVTRDVLAGIDVDRLLAGTSLKTRDMTRDERDARRARLNDDARRKRQQRKRTERVVRDDIHVSRADDVDDRTLREGLHIVAPTLRQIDRTTRHYGAKFAKTVGQAHLHEVATNTLDDLGRMVMTDEKHHPDVYRIACLYVATLPGVPDAPWGAPTGAGRYVAMMKRRARFNLIDWHRANPTLQSIELLSTVAANLYSSVDNLLAKGSPLNRNPFPLPGHTNTQFLRCIVDSTLEQMTVNEEPVGWLVDLLLDEDKRDNVGRFRWTEYGRMILTGLRLPVYENMTDLLIGVYAMKATQRVLRYLPEIIQEVIHLCGDPRLIGRYFDDLPHHSRLDLIDTGVPSFELSNHRKAIIIPEHLTSREIKDMYDELDSGLTAAGRRHRDSQEKRRRNLVKIATEIPTEFIVGEIQAVLRDLVDVEREQV